MPLVEVIHPEGAFTPEAKSKLLATLSSTCLRWEGIAINDVSQSIAWVYLDERPRNSISAGGHPLDQNVYLVNVRVMVGFMDYARIEGMVADVTQFDPGGGRDRGHRGRACLRHPQRGSQRDLGCRREGVVDSVHRRGPGPRAQARQADGSGH